MPQVLHANGIDGVLAVLESLSGKELQKTSEAVIKKVSTRAGVPLMRLAAKAAMRKADSHLDPKRDGKPMVVKRGRKGPIEKNITVKNIKKRRGEIVAVSIASRAWYRHFFIGRTKPHVIEARDAQGNRATSGEVRTINRLDAGYYRGNPSEIHALKVGERYYVRVNHPGTSENNFVDPLAGPIAAAMQKELTEELLRKTARAVRTATVRAAARQAAKKP